MAFDELMKALRTEGPKAMRGQWEPLACAAFALASTDQAQVHAHIARLQELGGSLENLGALALHANHRLIARVLDASFGVKVEDYQCTGGEMGVDAKQGYPLLAQLAYMRQAELLERALAWGANPDATWPVDRPMGLHHEKRGETLSWVGECIRGANANFLRKLLPHCAPSTQEEEIRRLWALHRVAAHANTTYPENRTRLAQTLKLFTVDGPYAMAQSFWDVPVEGTSESLAAQKVRGMMHYNRALSDHAHFPIVMEWLERTAPQDGRQQFDLALGLLGHKYKPGNFDRPIPAWCWQQLSDEQAQALLEHVLAVGFVAASRNRIDNMTRRAAPFAPALTHQLKEFAPQHERLLAAGVDYPGAFARVLSFLGPPDIRRMDPEAWQALAEQWPRHLTPLDAEPLFRDLVSLAQQRQGLATPDNPAATASVDAQLEALHAQAQMEASTPACPPTSRQMRL